MEAYEYVIFCTDPANVNAVLDSYDVIIDKMQRRAQSILSSKNQGIPLRSIITGVRKDYPELDAAIKAALVAGGSQGYTLTPEIKRVITGRRWKSEGRAYLNTALGVVLAPPTITRRKGPTNNVIDRRATSSNATAKPASRGRTAQQDPPLANETEYETFRRQMTAQGYTMVDINAKWKDFINNTSGKPVRKSAVAPAAKMTRTTKTTAKATAKVTAKVRAKTAAKPSPVHRTPSVTIATRAPRPAGKPANEEPVSMDEDDHQFHEASLQEEATVYEDDDYEDDEFYDDDEEGEDDDEDDDEE